jgi:predicted oxidoreductase
VSMQSLADGTLDSLQQRLVIPMAWPCLAGGSVLQTKVLYMQGVRKVLVQRTEEAGADSIDGVKTAVKAADIILNTEQWYCIWSLFKGRRVA